MSLSVEEIVAAALALPGEARAILADRLVESLDLADDVYLRYLWIADVRRHIDEAASGQASAGEEAAAAVPQGLVR